MMNTVFGVGIRRTVSHQFDGVQQLSNALAGGTGVSGGSAHTVPALLLPDDPFGWRITDMAHPTAARVTGEDGQPSYAVRGIDFNGSICTATIDANLLLLRHIHHGYGAGERHRPTLNPSIDSGWFKFDPDAPDVQPAAFPSGPPE
jgi:hypothetical protein